MSDVDSERRGGLGSGGRFAIERFLRRGDKALESGNGYPWDRVIASNDEMAELHRELWELVTGVVLLSGGGKIDGE